MFRISVWVCVCILSVSSALPMAAQTWTALRTAASFGAGTALLLTDGRVMVQQSDAGGWWTLTPDKTGSYINGSWKQVASLPSDYGPLYYASAVLPDGRLIIEGGEYNFGSQIDTNLGAIYDPVANTWTAISPPSGWSNIGDAPSVILNNGTFMLADPFSTATVLFNPSTFAWTPVGSGKIDSFSEEGMTLLPNGECWSSIPRTVPTPRDSTPRPTGGAAPVIPASCCRPTVAWASSLSWDRKYCGRTVPSLLTERPRTPRSTILQ